MVVIHSWGTVGPGESRVHPSVTVLEEICVCAQASFLWGWLGSYDG